jgi:hypothetical protein
MILPFVYERILGIGGAVAPPRQQEATGLGLNRD